MIQKRKGDFELDQLGKLILFAVILLVLISIVSFYFSGELSAQADRIKGLFDLF